MRLATALVLLSLSSPTLAADRAPVLGGTAMAGGVVGTIGALGAGYALALLASSPEPYGFFFVYPPSALLIAAGSGLANGSMLAQAHLTGASPRAAHVGFGLLVGGVVGGGMLVMLGSRTDSEAIAWTGLVGGTVAATGSLVAAAVQGSTNHQWAREPRPLTLVPIADPRAPGLAVVGRF